MQTTPGPDPASRKYGCELGILNSKCAGLRGLTFELSVMLNQAQRKRNTEPVDLGTHEHEHEHDRGVRELATNEKTDPKKRRGSKYATNR